MSEATAVTQTSTVQSEPVHTSELDVQQLRQEAPRVAICLVDSEVDIGTAVTLEALIEGKAH